MKTKRASSNARLVEINRGNRETEDTRFVSASPVCYNASTPTDEEVCIALAEVVALVAAGRVKPIVTGKFSLDQAETLHQRLRNREIVGRVVLEP